jgi:hypothetical protein
VAVGPFADHVGDDDAVVIGRQVPRWVQGPVQRSSRCIQGVADQDEDAHAEAIDREGPTAQLMVVLRLVWIARRAVATIVASIELMNSPTATIPKISPRVGPGSPADGACMPAEYSIAKVVSLSNDCDLAWSHDYGPIGPISRADDPRCGQ